MKFKKLFFFVCTLILMFSTTTEVNAVIYVGNSAMNHSKVDIIEKYNGSLPTFNYSNSVYVRNPVMTSPYFEGELQQGVIDDTLKQINFYRWLYGVNDVSINESKMQRSQRGAFINAVNGELTHYPSKKPDGMSDEFYADAVAGVGAGYNGSDDNYSGNVSWGSRIDQSIAGYIDDTNNVEPNVGHRLSLLDPYAYATSFGYIHGSSYMDRYGALSMYYNNTSEDTDVFYAWPSAGYFPVEVFPSKSNTLWSVWLGDNFRINYSMDYMTFIVITYNNKDYLVENAQYDSYYSTIYFSLPDEVAKAITDGDQYKPGEVVYVSVCNLYDSDYNEYSHLAYMTEFMDTKIHDLDAIDLYVMKDGDSEYVKVEDDFVFEKGASYSYMLDVVPSNATFDAYKLDSDSDNIIYDSESDKLIAVESGEVNFTISEDYNSYSNVITVKVSSPISGIELNKSTLSLLVGNSEKLIVSNLPEDTTDTTTYTWKSSNPSVASVDKDGNVLALTKGTTTITVTSEEGFTYDCVVTVSDFAKGDVDKSGNINLTDVIISLKTYLNINEMNDDDFVLYDMNDDEVFNLTDVILLLKTYLGIN